MVKLPRFSTTLYWHGWNAVAGYLATLGFLSALATWFLTSWILGETDLAKAITFGVAGISVTLCDLCYRGTNQDFGTIWRFVAPSAGGWVVLLPAWIVGGWMAATAIFYQI